MKRLTVVSVALSLGFVTVATGAPAGAVTAPAAGVAWAPCPADDPSVKGLECANLQVPLNYKKPTGMKITIALSRAKHTSPDAQYQGVALLNRGGPGGVGRDLPTRFATGSNGLPKEIGATYDWIGFDPRGVGASSPSLTCNNDFFKPVRPDTVPSSKAEEAALVKRAKGYARACQQKFGWLLPHMTTRDAARDVDAIRAALGQKKINYFGYSYGTYLGAVYGSLFPSHVRRMVLDSVVRPSGVWYDDNIDQNFAFDKNAKTFFGWVAKYDSTYHLGTTQDAVEKNYYAIRAKVKAQPAGGKVGPSELEDTTIDAGYRNYRWALHAKGLSDYFVKGDPAQLITNFDNIGATPEDNGFAVYNAVQCSDAKWPRDWRKWHNDSVRVYKKAPFLTWNNTWFNAACAFWPVPGGTPTKISGKGLPGVLLVQATQDAATPYPGGVELHKAWKSSRLIAEIGGVNHGVSLSANGDKCANAIVSAYLGTGVLPPSKPGPDATCAAPPFPQPTAATAKSVPVDDILPAGRP